MTATGTNSVFDVTHFGAKGGRDTIDTPAINRAIDSQQQRRRHRSFSPPALTPATPSASRATSSSTSTRGATILAADQPSAHCQPGYDPPSPTACDPLSGLRPQPLAQQPHLGRGPREHRHPRPRPHLGQRPEPRMARRPDAEIPASATNPSR